MRVPFASGFLILFTFIGTFTYVNFHLMSIGLSPMTLGLVYLVFLPSMLTTPLAGKLTSRVGDKIGIISTLALAVVGLTAVVSASLSPILMGLTFIGIGTFLAQAVATGLVGRRAAAGNKVRPSRLILIENERFYTGIEKAVVDLTNASAQGKEPIIDEATRGRLLDAFKAESKVIVRSGESEE
ncbi:hypothetical protein ACC720_36395 [Rhizobium ruizarguesonis]|uniref:hypothetical protein n=1 Tax=Rhizobium ruizarguesonis TaxID=2081791 RepID=UPI001FDEF0AF|nr:hypothetical protein [Rhizobium ruizarguesonis]